jgi:hypothetical protein
MAAVFSAIPPSAGAAGVALMVCGMVWRGWLILKPAVEKVYALYEARILESRADTEHWREAAEHWRAAFESGQEIKRELAEQNSKLLSQSEITVRMLESVRAEAEKRGAA